MSSNKMWSRTVRLADGSAPRDGVDVGTAGEAPGHFGRCRFGGFGG